MLFFIKKIWKLSWPIIIGQMSYVLMGIADNIMVGQVNAASVATVGVCNSIFFTVTIIGIGIFSILPPLISKSKAEEDYEKCGYLLNNGVLISLWLGLLLMCVTLFLSGNFEWFAQEESVNELAPAFLRMLGFSAIPMFVFLAAKQFTDGLGFTRESMALAMGAVVLNIILNYILIYGHCGFSPMGALGAGWATFISRIFMAAGILLFIFKSKKTMPYRPANLWLKNRLYHREILKDGIPSGFQYFFEIAAFSVANIFMGMINKEASAAHQIVISFAALTYLFVSGIGIGGSIMVSESLGEKNRHHAYLYGINSIRMAFVIEIITCVLFLVFQKTIPSLYIENEAVLNYAVPLMVIAALFQIPDGIQCVSLGVLRGIYDVRWPTVFTLLAYWGVALPLSYYLGFVAGWGAQGIWWGLTIGLITSALLLFFRFYYIARPEKSLLEEA